MTLNAMKLNTVSIVGMVLAAGSVLAYCSSAHAALTALESAQAGAATYAWDFETPNRLDDKTSNTNNLTATETVGTLTDPSGFAGDSAIKFPATEAYASAGSFLQPNNATFEFLLQPGAGTGSEEQFLSQQQSSTNRNHMYHDALGSKVRWRRGNGSLSETKDIIGGGSSVAYDETHWYYMALASSYNDGANTHTLNVYVRDLTAEGSLVQVLNNVAVTGTGGSLGTTGIGIGRKCLQWKHDIRRVAELGCLLQQHPFVGDRPDEFRPCCAC